MSLLITLNNKVSIKNLKKKNKKDKAKCHVPRKKLSLGEYTDSVEKYNPDLALLWQHRWIQRPHPGPCTFYYKKDGHHQFFLVSWNSATPPPETGLNPITWVIWAVRLKVNIWYLYIYILSGCIVARQVEKKVDNFLHISNSGVYRKL